MRDLRGLEAGRRSPQTSNREAMRMCHELEAGRKAETAVPSRSIPPSGLRRSTTATEAQAQRAIDDLIFGSRDNDGADVARYFCSSTACAGRHIESCGHDRPCDDPKVARQGRVILETEALERRELAFPVNRGLHRPVLAV